MFTFRNADSTDKEQLIRISSKIWEGDDYLADVFDEWVADKNSELILAEYNNRIVGCGRIAYLTNTDVWLEGLRADPDAGIKGIGTAIMEYIVAKLKKMKGLTSVRFSTYYDNTASQIITTRLGFKHIHTLSNKVGIFNHANMGRLHSDIVNGKDTFPTVADICTYIRNSTFFKESAHLICVAWVCYPFSEKFIKEYFLQTNQYLLEVKNNRIEGLLLYDMINNTVYKTCKLSFLSTESDACADRLLKAIKHLCAVNEVDNIEVKAPPSSLEHLQRAGFTSWERENDFLIYEYPI